MKHLIVTAALLLFFAGYSLASVTDNPVHQLRIYTVPKQNQKVFHDRFRDHAHRIMKKYDFSIVAIWESETSDKLEFIYLLEWPDKKTMEESWAKFMADEEWKEIKRKTSSVHGTFVEGIEDKTLLLTDYSPVKVFLQRKRRD
jgi:hypothetical protein